jgi:hypothetical protein
MHDRSKLRARITRFAGRACVLATLALLSPGVHVARAGDARPAPATVAPAARPAVQPLQSAVATPALPAPAAVAPARPPSGAPSSPFVHVDDVENARRPGVSGVEVAPGVVVLNTRGFNYGPPPTPIAPEAMRQEDPAARR